MRNPLPWPYLREELAAAADRASGPSAAADRSSGPSAPADRASDSSAVSGAENVAWNLDDLQKPPAEAGIEAVLTDVDRRVQEFADRYRGKIGGLSARQMKELLEEYESMLDALGKATNYAGLWWAGKTDDPARGALLQKVTERQSQLAQKAVFLDIEWANAPEDAARRLMTDPLLEKWRHYLITSRRYQPHLLSEPEEKMLTEKSVTGRQAWTRFYDEAMSSTQYAWEGGTVTQEVILRKHLHSPDRAVRERAAASLTEGLRAIQKTTTFVFNTLLAEKASDDRLRRYDTWISSRNLDNQVEDATVDALVNAVTSRYDIVARYYRLKRRLLGLSELFDYDRYAELPAAERHYPWDQAQGIVLAAFQRFHPRMAEIAGLFFEKGWIDAAIRPGKRGGGFCDPTVPSVHPYILLNYQGTADDVMTLAHELGHGVHGYLARERGVLQQNTPLTTAETASVFGETLVFNDLLSRETDPKVSLAMIVREIEGSFATVFRQVAMNRFEHAIHTARRSEGELTTEALSAHWLATQRAMFTDSVTLRDDYGIWWSYIPHFLHTPGYVYAYAFGDLLVRALYARYEAAGSDAARRRFAEQYIGMLAAGGSDWPSRLVAPLGVDLTDPGFWAQGLAGLEQMVAQAERMGTGA